MTYPTIMPAITLDFQNSQQLDPRVTFSRSSGATYINSAGSVVSAADHEPRFDHDPVTGESLGLLVEESRTNYAPVSQPTTSQLLTADTWITMSDGFAAPDGTTSAVKLISTAGADQNSTNRGVRYSTPYPMPTTGYITCSVYVKPLNNLAKVSLCGPHANGGFYGPGGTRVDFTVSPPVVTLSTNFGYEGGSLKGVGNGWYRIEFLFNLDNSQTTPSGTTTGPRVNPWGAGTEVLFWGLQMEAAKFPTSYIPTAGATATRAADICDITGTNLSSWWNASQWSVLVDVKGSSVLTGYGFTAHDNNKDRRYSLSNEAFIERTNQLPSGGSTTAYPNPPLTSPYTYKAAAAKNVQGSDDGVAYYDANKANSGGTSFSCADLTPAKVEIGYCSFFASSHINGHISRLSYYNERLTDAELQTLTL